MSTKCLFLRDYKVGTIVVSDFESIFRCSRTSLHRVAHRRTSRYISVIYTDFPHLHKIERTRTKSRYKVAPKVAPKKVGERQSIFSSVARLQVDVVGRNCGSRAGELKMCWTKPPRCRRRYGY